MVSDFSAAIFLAALIAIILFFIWSFKVCASSHYWE